MTDHLPPGELPPDDFSDLTEPSADWDDIETSFPPKHGPLAEPPTPSADEAGVLSVGALEAGSGRPQFRLPTLVFGLLLAVMGAVFVWPVLSEGYILVPGAIIAIGAGGIALSLLAHWLSSGRMARGAFFLAITGVLWGALIGLLILDSTALRIADDWPLFVVALGFALLLTYAGDRRHDRRLLPPAFIVITAGVTAILVTRGILPQDVIALARDAWQIVVVILILCLLPLGIRRTSRRNA